MAFSKYRGFHKKKLNSELGMIVSSLKKENAYLKKTLVVLSHHHSEHIKLVERFLSLQIVKLESCPQQKAKGEKIASPPEQPSKKKGKLTDDSTSDEWASTYDIKELQNHLSDALEKNKEWLEYDQQREAYVKAILARMLWLEKQLNEANQALSQQHNEDHSDEKRRIRQMQEHYERLLQKAKDELEVLRKQVDMTTQNLIMTQNWCEERQKEVEELKQQVQTEEMNRKSAAEDHHCSGDEEQELRDETKDPEHKLDEEKCWSADFELETFMLNRHHADKEKIEELERQKKKAKIKISSQDLEDERQNCSYLKKQMVRVLKMLKKTKDRVTKQTKRDQQECRPCEGGHPPSPPSRNSPMSSSHSSLLNESFLECPSCRAEYPASHYRDLMNHLEICLD